MVAKIVDGRPIPALRRKGAPPKYPWLQLKPGQAFQFEPHVTLGGARSMASQMICGDHAHLRFAVRVEPDGIFCWRVDGIAASLASGNERRHAPIIEKPAVISEEDVV